MFSLKIFTEGRLALGVETFFESQLKFVSSAD
jgi:hypothetical protein